MWATLLPFSKSGQRRLAYMLKSFWRRGSTAKPRVAFIDDLHEGKERTIPGGVVTVDSERSGINSQSLPTQSEA